MKDISVSKTLVIYIFTGTVIEKKTRNKQCPNLALVRELQEPSPRPSYLFWYKSTSGVESVMENGPSPSTWLFHTSRRGVPRPALPVWAEVGLQGGAPSLGLTLHQGETQFFSV